MAACTDLHSSAPFSRWDTERLYSPEGGPGRTAARFATFVVSTYAFDGAAFGVAPGEAALMDPQQRLLMEETLAALHHAGHQPQVLAFQGFLRARLVPCILLSSLVTTSQLC